MPRQARKDAEAPYYHVMVQGINKNFILNSYDDKLLFFKLVKKLTKEYEIDIIAYCIMDSHAHLLLKSKTITDLSLCMKRLNTTFAMRYNKGNDRVGYVFRSRFKHEPIYDHYYLHNCIKYIHMNPVKAKICDKPVKYLYSSYKRYLDKSWFVNEELFKEIFPTEEEFLKVLDEKEVEYSFIDEGLSIDEAKDWLDEYMEKMKLSYSDLYRKKEVFSDVAKKMKMECKLKNIEIAKLMNVSTTKICRILQESEKKENGEKS